MNNFTQVPLAPCEAEPQQCSPESNIKTNLDTTIEVLKMCNLLTDDFIRFVWAEEPNIQSGIEIKGLDTAVVCARDGVLALYEKLNIIAKRFGLH